MFPPDTHRWPGNPIWFLTVMFQDRHLAGGGMGEDAIFKSVNIELDQFFVEFDAGAAEHQPATQRPRRIIFVADDDFHD